jgi:hypothetical protein
MGDFKPYLLKSTDLGKSWTSIAANLPDRGSVWTIAQDHQDPDLLFCGTEFGVFFTTDGGKRWIQLKGNLPVIPVRDIAIQKRENDLVLGTFGRGFYVLDDYSPLRGLNESTLQQEAVLHPVKQGWMYIPELPLGLKEKSMMGDSHFTSPNPPFGAVITYYLKDEIKTRKKARQESEKELVKSGRDSSMPAWSELEAEDREEAPAVILTISDEAGNVVRRLEGPVTAGFHRVAWDLRYPAQTPPSLTPPADDNPWDPPPQGPLALPGRYKVTMAKRVDGKITALASTQTIETSPLGTATLPVTDRKAVMDFAAKTARLQRAVTGTVESTKQMKQQLELLKKAVNDIPHADANLHDQVRSLLTRVQDIEKELTGNATLRKRNEPTPPSLSERVENIVTGHWTTTSAPTGTMQRNYDVAAADFEALLQNLKAIDAELRELQNKAEAAGAPWTPGRLPQWQKE